MDAARQFSEGFRNFRLDYTPELWYVIFIAPVVALTPACPATGTRMPTTNPQCYHLSASSIQSFKACPQRFRLAYREGLRADRDTDSQRAGTNWHAMHEEYANSIAAWKANRPDDTAEDRNIAALQAVIDLLNVRYEKVPSWIDSTDWALERQVLLTSFVAYLWYWQNDPVEFIASEVPFNLPLHEPRTGMPLSMKSAQRVGKIDHVIKWHDGIGALERKSTTRSIAPDSDYWQKSSKDTQVSMYALAFSDMSAAGLLPPGIQGGERFGNTLYDVWHKPTIKPTTLTQAATKVFLDTGVYMECSFTPVVTLSNIEGTSHLVSVDGITCEVEMGKKGFAIKETVEMFGARLLQDIYERPDFYFARREIARTQAELREFRKELFAIYSAQSAFSKGNYWFSNESACRATFPCTFIPICYGPGASAVCDGSTTPVGFKRIFVDLTVNGKEVEE